MNLDDIKQFFHDTNSKGIKVPMLRDPKTDTASVSLTMMFISFNVVLAGLVGKFAGFLGGINLEQAIYFFMVCSGLYFARSVSSSKTGTKIEEKSKENNNE